MAVYTLARSKRKDKKFSITTPNDKIIYFGAKGYQDYTMHKDKKRLQSYISRHSVREKWGKNGVETAGFWARWLLWNLPTLDASIKDVEARFGIKINRR